MIILELPFPDSNLMPNKARGLHWRTKGNIAKIAREQAYYLCKESLGGVSPTFTEKIPVTVVFYPPDKRGRDLDNLLAASKSFIDGICEALDVNDKSFSPITLDWGTVGKPGKMVVKIG